MGFGKQHDSARNLDAELEGIVAEYQTPLIRYAARLVNDGDAARDVVQKTFLKLFDNWKNKGYPEIVKPKSWLYRVAHNLAVDHVRAESRRQDLHEREATDPAFSAASARHSESHARQQEVLRHLDVLTEVEKQVLLLRLEEGLSYKEIAAVTKRTEGNIGCVLHHAVKKVGAKIKKAQREDGAFSVPGKNGGKKTRATAVPRSPETK